jgi:hypothetical protein
MAQNRTYPSSSGEIIFSSSKIRIGKLDYINITIRAEVIAQDGAKEGKFNHLPALTNREC